MTKTILGLVTFETLITILTIENLNSRNICDLTIKSDTGQNSQYFRCLEFIDPILIMRALKKRGNG